MKKWSKTSYSIEKINISIAIVTHLLRYYVTFSKGELNGYESAISSFLWADVDESISTKVMTSRAGARETIMA